MQTMNYRLFTLKNSFFDNRSLLHGINHTYRVMFHVLNIGEKAGLNDHIKPAWCAAFIHDMARQHDGYCTKHGYWAAQKKLPLFTKLFRDTGITDEEMEAIKLAVTNHSLSEELPPDHPHYQTVALLKDADALDRIRIGKNNLKVNFLRFPESIQLVGLAEKLFYLSDLVELQNFDMLLNIAKKLKE
jgi:HD superfamily phosphodiesterase